MENEKKLSNRVNPPLSKGGNLSPPFGKPVLSFSREEGWEGFYEEVSNN